MLSYHFRIIRILFFLFITTTTGCATFLENGTPPPPVQTGKAVVFANESLLNYPKANMNIVEVNGHAHAKFKSSTHAVTLDPGSYYIDVIFYSSGYASSAMVNGEFQSDHVYEIIAILGEDNIYNVTLVDVTNSINEILFSSNPRARRAP